MENPTLSTADKELLLKMAGVLIRTKELWDGGTEYIAVDARGNEVEIEYSMKRCIKRAFNKLTRE